MNNETTQLNFNLTDLNREWSELLSQLLVDRLTLKKQIEQLEQLEEQNKSLKAQLHQAQNDLLAAQGKAIIDNSTQSS